MEGKFEQFVKSADSRISIVFAKRLNLLAKLQFCRIVSTSECEYSWTGEIQT